MVDVQRIEPGPGQESVWDYPRPPAIEPTAAHLRVELDGVTIAETTHGIRILETSQPPAYYFPPEDVRMDLLHPSTTRTFCEWKGQATYFSAPGAEDVAWSYPHPVERYAAIRDHLAFYAQRVDACFVDGEQVRGNDGSFYGGWITSKVVGPFKGGPGTAGW
jgi:uncharacterized protein (DUF427 family)